MCEGVRGCARVCEGVRGCVRVCEGVCISIDSISSISSKLDYLQY